MEETIRLVERFGSLGILVLIIWKIPAIIGAFTNGIGMVVDKISVMQDKNLAVFEKQQETERTLMITRFEVMEKSLERVGNALEANMKVQNETLIAQNDIKNRLQRLEDKK